MRYELLLLSFQVAVSSAEQPNPKVTLTFIWHAGDRATLFQKISREYTKQTGMEIKAVLLRTGAGARGLLSLTRW